MKTRYSLILDVDSYKSSHYLQYPKGTSNVFSYIESRGGKYDHTVFFGLQYYLKEYLTHRITVEEVEEAKSFFAVHGEPFNYEGWLYIAEELKGRLPLRIRAVPEGSVVPTHNILVSVENTDPKCFWLTSWVETLLLRVWYPTTVCTRSHHIKSIIMEALNRSSDDPGSEINFKLHDFGSRGVSSQESAMIGGAAHLVNFMGSDTVVGVVCANKYYNTPMSGFSIPAAEHSTICSWGKENELEAYRNMLHCFAAPNSLVAVVSDSYDLFNAVENLWGDKLKQEVIDSKATVVIRPDSGHPATIVLKTAQLLEKKFGITRNKKGFRVLNNIRIIQGDGINEDSIKEILDTLLEHGYSATNIAFGMGGGLLQDLNRDSLKFAMKASNVIVDGEHREVFKDPITDPGKRSKGGKLDLIKEENYPYLGAYKTVKLSPGHIQCPNSEMQIVFENGELFSEDNLETIRRRSQN